MKNNIFRNTIITGAVCTVLVTPSYAQDVNVRPISTEDIAPITISYTFAHWSETYINQLSRNYDVELVFKDKDLDATITVEDFQKLIKLTIDKEYDKTPDVITRESIVHEFAKIWAEKTDQDLERIPTIKMIIFPDTHKIDVKYNHSVTIAYMNDIVKGRDIGVFDPKSDITYGEVATLIAKTEKAIENELKPDNESIVEGKFETRASYEIKDDKVVFDFELMNHYTESKELKFGSGQQFEVVITDEKGEEVYRYSDDKFFTLALIFKTIKPGESIKWKDEWNMTNKEGTKLIKGKYKAEIKVMVIGKEDEKKIERSQVTKVVNFSL